MKYDNDSKFEMINELIEYIMTNDTMVMHALAHRDKKIIWKKKKMIEMIVKSFW